MTAPNQTTPLSCSFFSATHTGHRQENQDSFKVFTNPSGGEYWLVVADGMGGHRGGSIASRSVIEASEKCWSERHERADPKVFLQNFVEQAHQAINNAAEHYPDTNPKSTVAALLIRDGKAVSVHVGDSRVIQFTDHQYVKRTLDHSVVQLQVLDGKVAEADMATHPDQNKLTNNLGGDQIPEPEIESWPLSGNDLFVVCSDGFWELFDADQMIKALSSMTSNQQLLSLINDKLAAFSNHDNTTVIVATVGAPGAVTSKRNTSKLPTSKRSAWQIPAAIAALVLSLAVFLWITDSNQTPEDSNQPNPTSQNKETNPEIIPESNQDGSQSQDKSQGNNKAIDEGGVDKTADTTEQTPTTETGTKPNYSIPHIPTINLETSIAKASESDGSKETEDYLKETGQLGENDKLSTDDSKSRSIGNKKIVLLQQTYKNLPVIGAEIRTTIDENKIVRVSGKPIADVEVNIDPQLTFQQALKIAASELNEELSSDKTARLVIFSTDLGFRLAWQGAVNTKLSQEVMIIAADDGQILLRQPLLIGGTTNE